MTAQKGKDLLIKIDMTGSGDYTTLGGLRAQRIAFNAQTVDVSNIESSGGWRELLGGAGMRSATLSGSGVFLDSDADARARQVFFDGDVPDFQIIIPDFGTITGAFQITSLEYAGQHDAEATYEMALASAGALAWVAA
ncbi:MAG: phage major tail protein, TP901-1 family [Paracoccaceae bacterium]